MQDGARVLDLSDIRSVLPDMIPPVILVRECYVDALDAVLRYGAYLPRVGMIFTGQPGTGERPLVFPARGH